MAQGERHCRAIVVHCRCDALRACGLGFSQDLLATVEAGVQRALLEGEVPSPIRAIGDDPVVQPLVQVGPGHFVARHPVGDYR